MFIWCVWSNKNSIFDKVQKSLLAPIIAKQWYSSAKNNAKDSNDPCLRSITIKELFNEHKQEIKEFKKEKPEIYKVLDYIMKSNTKVMKAQADTIGIKLHNNLDHLAWKGDTVQLKDIGIRIGTFSKAKWGEKSEESRILKAFFELKKEAKIVNEVQLIQHFLNLLHDEQWACNIFGC